jgi:asparagine synthetase B (glutamine-hydrolysing)
MCGIFVSVSVKSSSCIVRDEHLQWISARGPDSLKTLTVQIPARETQDNLDLTFTSSVLHLRGQHVTVQPLVSEDGDILCWNGEVWKGLEVKEYENDGLKLLESLSSGAKVWDIMGSIEGPWAMVYYSSKDRRLWYGRDGLGRRSLVKRRDPQTGGLLLSSVGIDMYEWEEVGVDGLWCLDLSNWDNVQKEVYPTSIYSHRSVRSSCIHGYFQANNRVTNVDRWSSWGFHASNN